MFHESKLNPEGILLGPLCWLQNKIKGFYLTINWDNLHIFVIRRPRLVLPTSHRVNLEILSIWILLKLAPSSTRETASAVSSQ